MTKWQDKLDDLWVETQQSIIDKVKQIGVESENFSFKVIKVDDELAFNLDGKRYLTEIGQDNLVDSAGQLYNYGSLDHEQLAELADWVETLPVTNEKPKTLEEAIGIIEKSWQIDEYEENDRLCGYELNTYTERGVNEIVFLDFRNKNLDPKNLEDFLTEFESFVDDLDIDERINNNMQDAGYRNDFTLSEALEDFTQWKEAMIGLLNKLR
jgi:hypothetical protein